MADERAHRDKQNILRNVINLHFAIDQLSRIAMIKRNHCYIILIKYSSSLGVGGLLADLEVISAFAQIAIKVSLMVCQPVISATATHHRHIASWDDARVCKTPFGYYCEFFSYYIHLPLLE